MWSGNKGKKCANRYDQFAESSSNPIYITCRVVLHTEIHLVIPELQAELSLVQGRTYGALQNGKYILKLIFNYPIIGGMGRFSCIIRNNFIAIQHSMIEPPISLEL